MLTVHNLSKTFHIHQLGREVAAFGDVSFGVAAGEFVLIGGANGAGKSTLLRCLYRTYVPSSGSAVYNSLAGPIDLARAADVDIVALRGRELGHVTQFLRPRPRVPAIDLVAEPLVQRGASWEAARALAGALLTDFGLKPAIWAAYPSTFSGGEQQKVNLAKSLIAPYRLLLLDEPTASLDAMARRALVSRLAAIKAEGVALIGVFHHPEDVAALVDREIQL